jgi:hypothetical protein
MVHRLGHLNRVLRSSDSSIEQDTESKTFTKPAADKAGLYVYRNTIVGQALKKTVSVDGVPIGETANVVYLHRLIAPGQHLLSTESEFSDNAVELDAQPGTNYFFEQHIKMGIFVGGARLRAVSEEEGKQGVLACKEALGFQAAEPEPASSTVHAVTTEPW